MKYHFSSFFGWIRFSEIVLPIEAEEYSNDLKWFHEQRLKWDDLQWFPERAAAGGNPLRLAAATRSPC